MTGLRRGLAGGLLWLWLCAGTAPLAAQSLPTAHEALRRGEYARAESEYTRLHEAAADARAQEARLGLAQVWFATGRYDQAAELARGVTAGPLRVAAQTLGGEALAARGHYVEAERAFASVLDDPAALRARVRLGLLLLQQGRVSEARPHLMALIDAYNDDRLAEPKAEALCYVAMAARALGSFHDANDAFREAALQDRTRVQTQLEWAGLFLEKYDRGHAQQSVQDALAQNPHEPLALTLLARIQLEQGMDFGAANALLDRALGTNPNLIAAHVTRAKLALRDMALQRADAHLDRALAVNPRDLEALSVRAAARFLADDTRGFALATKKVLAQNPRFSRMYSIIAEYAEWEHRYEELIEMAEKALTIDPEDALAHATLGLNLLRMGDEKRGLPELEQAWRRDRFNAHVFNTLNLYDEVIAKEYVDFESGVFTLRVHRDEREVLEPYLGPLLARAYGQMRARYGFTPRGPLRFEMYADAQHFSVRTTGLPNVGVQGVCFGKVITAISPRGGPFNWGQISWHELAHVFHLQLSRNHVPRWFTEGLAEYETIIARPEWRREEDHNLWEAQRAGEVPRLSQLNSAFTGARSAKALMTAYYVASQAVVWLVEQHGFDKVPKLLQAWGRGLRSEQVFAQVLGVGLPELDAAFAAHLEQRLSRFAGEFDVDFGAYEDLDALEQRARARPGDVDALAALAMGYALKGQWAAANAAGLDALKLSGTHPIAHFALSRVALQEGDARRARRCLGAIVAGGQDGYLLRLLLGRAAMAMADWAGARRHGLQATRLDPDGIEAWQLLLEVSEKQGDMALSVRAIERIAGLDQHDRVSHLALLALRVRKKDWAGAVAIGESGLFIDPASPQLHRLLGQAQLENGDPARALALLDQALVLKHPRPGGVQMLRARALLAQGKAGPAREAAQAAVVADPGLRREAEALVGP